MRRILCSGREVAGFSGSGSTYQRFLLTGINPSSRVHLERTAVEAPCREERNRFQIDGAGGGGSRWWRRQVVEEAGGGGGRCSCSIQVERTKPLCSRATWLLGRSSHSLFRSLSSSIFSFNTTSRKHAHPRAHAPAPAHAHKHTRIHTNNGNIEKQMYVNV